MKQALTMMPWGLVTGLAAAALLALAASTGTLLGTWSEARVDIRIDTYSTPADAAPAIVAAARQAAGLDPAAPSLGDGPRRVRPMLASGAALPALWTVAQSPSASPSLRGSAPPANPDGPITIPCNPLGNSTSLTSCPSFRSAGASVASAEPRSSSVARLRLPMLGNAMAS